MVRFDGKSLEDWRNRQIAGLKDPGASPKVSELKISDDELRETIVANHAAIANAAQVAGLRAAAGCHQNALGVFGFLGEDVDHSVDRR